MPPIATSPSRQGGWLRCSRSLQAAFAYRERTSQETHCSILGSRPLLRLGQHARKRQLSRARTVADAAPAPTSTPRDRQRRSRPPSFSPKEQQDSPMPPRPVVWKTSWTCTPARFRPEDPRGALNEAANDPGGRCARPAAVASSNRRQRPTRLYALTSACPAGG